MTIREVNSKESESQFLNLSRNLYKDDPHWVCPLDKDIKTIFDKKKNIFFQHGEATRWLLEDSHGNIIGRVAAFINHNKLNKGFPTGGMGFFECIEDKDAAFFLFNTCKDWLSHRGMKGMLGPINFGENENFWGLLVEGFTHPSYGMNYNKPYYKDFFEEYGFEKQYEQITNHLDLTRPLPERFSKIASWVSNKPQNRLEYINLKMLDNYIKDFLYIYNLAWANHENFTPLEWEYAQTSIKQLLPFIEEKFIWFAYVNDEPAGFIMAAPDVNQILKHMKGKMNLINKLKFFWLKKKKIINRVRIIVMGINPKYQRLGLESALIYNGFTAAIPMKQYVEGELSWVGDFNDKMIAIHEALGATIGKKHFTYLKKFSKI